MKCNMCPRRCNADRHNHVGFCGMGELPVVARAFLHRWEEPCISGSRGSGTVFFTGCNLQCVYCQNYKISQLKTGKEINLEQLGKIMRVLQEQGAHNINLVNPTHYADQIRECIVGLPELRIPVVYNTNGYESVETLKHMEGIVDVYLPDLKYFYSETSTKYSCAGDYFETAAAAVLEMYRQVGDPVFDKDGLIQRGLIIRHLILPGRTSESMKILQWIKEHLPSTVFISLMSQYTPYFKAESCPEINRRITRREYDKVVSYLWKIGIENGYVQERESADEQYIPDFDLQEELLFLQD